MLKVQSPSVYAPPGRSTNGSEMVVLPRYAQPSEPDGLEPHAAQQPPPRMHVVQEQREVRSWKDRGDRMEAGKEGRNGEGTPEAGVAPISAPSEATTQGQGTWVPRTSPTPSEQPSSR